MVEQLTGAAATRKAEAMENRTVKCMLVVYTKWFYSSMEWVFDLVCSWHPQPLLLYGRSTKFRTCRSFCGTSFAPLAAQPRVKVILPSELNFVFLECPESPFGALPYFSFHQMCSVTSEEG